MVGKIFQYLVDVRFIAVGFYDGRFNEKQLLLMGTSINVGFLKVVR
jgi:hypothetical protein